MSSPASRPCWKPANPSRPRAGPSVAAQWRRGDSLPHRRSAPPGGLGAAMRMLGEEPVDGARDPAGWKHLQRFLLRGQHQRASSDIESAPGLSPFLSGRPYTEAATTGRAETTRCHRRPFACDFARCSRGDTARHRGPMPSALDRSAFPRGERLNDDRSVRGCQSAEVIGISRLYNAATRFDCHGDGMSVCEERGTGTCLGE